MDINGNPLLDKNGKHVLHHSYSVLQDDFYNHMVAAGYTDIERGEHGSSEEHLTVTQFKVDREEHRFEIINEKCREMSSEFSELKKEKHAAEKKLDSVNQEIDQKQKRLEQLTPKVKDAEQFVAAYLDSPEKLLPEASTLEYASHYREKKAKPIIRRLWNVALSLYHKLQEAHSKLKSLQKQFETASHDRDILKRRWENALVENADMKSELRDHELIKKELTPEEFENVLTVAKDREAAKNAVRHARHHRPEHEGR